MLFLCFKTDIKSRYEIELFILKIFKEIKSIGEIKDDRKKNTQNKVKIY